MAADPTRFVGPSRLVLEVGASHEQPDSQSLRVERCTVVKTRGATAARPGVLSLRRRGPTWLSDPTEVVLMPADVVLTRVGTVLDLDDDQFFLALVGEAVLRTERHVD